MVGIPATLISQLFISISRMGVKYLYVNQPQMSTPQLLLYRAIVAFAFNIVWLNVRLKHEMWTSVRRDLVGQLTLKVLHGNFQQYVLYTSVMYWPLTTTAAARLASPFLTLLLACIFLREFATKGQLLYISLVMGSAMLIVCNTPPRNADE